MKDKLRDYIEQIFADAPECQRVKELKEELYADVCDKYDDLLREGKSEAAAYNAGIASIGDVSALVEELKREYEGVKGESVKFDDDEPDSCYYTVEEKEQIARYRKRSGVLSAVAVAIYILCWVPLVILAELFPSTASEIVGIVIMMAMIAIATGMFIIKPYLKPACMIGKRDRDLEEQPCKKPKKPKRALYHVINTVLWVLTFIWYFTASFGTGAWHITWLIFLVAGAIEGVIEAIFDLVESQKVKGAVVRLVVLTIVAVVLASILGFYVSSSDLDWSFDGFTFSIVNGEFYADGDKYNVGNWEYTDNVTDIEIDWVAGNVDVVIWDGEYLKIEESGASDEDDMMRSRVVGGKLTVKSAKSGIRWFSSYSEKDLTVYIPEQMVENMIDVDIEVVSGETCVCGDFGSVSVDAASASVTLNGSFRELEIDTVSGNVVVEGSVNSFRVDAVSAAVVLTASNTPSSIQVEAVSGDIKVTLPESAGFVAELDSVSGKMVCNGKKGSRYSYGDGSADYDFETVSGDVTITVK